MEAWTVWTVMESSLLNTNQACSLRVSTQQTRTPLDVVVLDGLPNCERYQLFLMRIELKIDVQLPTTRKLKVGHVQAFLH